MTQSLVESPPGRAGFGPGPSGYPPIRENRCTCKITSQNVVRYLLIQRNIYFLSRVSLYIERGFFLIQVHMEIFTSISQVRLI